MVMENKEVTKAFSQLSTCLSGNSLEYKWLEIPCWLELNKNNQCLNIELDLLALGFITSAFSSSDDKTLILRAKNGALHV